MFLRDHHRIGTPCRTMTRPAIPALTSVRFFFALMVIATHFQGFSRVEGVPSWVGPLGNIAVSWFFILSGFILAYNFPRLATHRATTEFLIARFWRLFPLQALTLLASYLMFESSRHLVEVSPTYLWRSLSLTHAWTASPFAAQAFNVPAWSISHEWFFYLAFPLLIAWGWKSALGFSLLAAAIAVSWATSLGCWDSAAAFQAPGDSYDPTCNAVLYYWPPARLWEFATGIGLCAIAVRLHQRGIRAWFQPVMVTSAVLMFVYRADLMWFIPFGFFSHTFAGWAVSTLVGCMIILGLSQDGLVAEIMRYRHLVFAGEISFSMYMIHMLILRYADATGVLAGPPYILSFILVCAVTIAISAATFLLIEQPSRSWLKSLMSGPRQPRPAIAVK